MDREEEMNATVEEIIATYERGELTKSETLCHLSVSAFVGDAGQLRRALGLVTTGRECR
jgi:hypothetical protein